MLKYEKFQNVRIYSLGDKEKYITFRSLINEAKTNQSKFKFITFNKCELLQLVKTGKS